MRSGADLALLPVLLLGHADVGVVSEAGLAEDRKVCILPVLSVVSVGALGGSHLDQLSLLYSENKWKTQIWLKYFENVSTYKERQLKRSKTCIQCVFVVCSVSTASLLS